MKEVYLKHNSFITAIAVHKHNPSNTNIHLKEIVAAWKDFLKDTGSKVIVNECGSCGGGYLDVVKDIYVYAKRNNWDEPEVKITARVIETEIKTEPIINSIVEQPNKRGRKKRK